MLIAGKVWLMMRFSNQVRSVVNAAFSSIPQYFDSKLESQLSFTFAGFGNNLVQNLLQVVSRGANVSPAVQEYQCMTDPFDKCVLADEGLVKTTTLHSQTGFEHGLTCLFHHSWATSTRFSSRPPSYFARSRYA